MLKLKKKISWLISMVTDAGGEANGAEEEDCRGAI